METNESPAEDAVPNPPNAGEALERECDARAIADARSAVDVFSSALILVAVISAFGLPAVLYGITMGRTSDARFREALPLAFTFAGAVGTWFGLRRSPRTALVSGAIVIALLLASLVRFVPFGEWFARSRDIGDWTILFVAALVFAPLIGFGLRRRSPWLIGIGGYFTFHAVIWMYVVSAYATATAGGIVLVIGSLVVWSRVQRAWPSIRRHPDWFFPPRRRRRQVADVTLASHPVDPGLRAPSGITRSFLRWKRLTRPSIRSGGVGGLGIH